MSRHHTERVEFDTEIAGIDVCLSVTRHISDDGDDWEDDDPTEVRVVSQDGAELVDLDGDVARAIADYCATHNPVGDGRDTPDHPDFWREVRR